MKKYLLSALLAACFLFLGVNSVKANYSFTINSVSTSNSSGAFNLATSPIATSATNYAVYGFNFTGNGGGGANSTVSGFQFQNIGTSSGTTNNSFFTTATLYEQTTQGTSYGSPATAIATYTPDGTNVVTFNFANITVNGASNITFYVVFSNNIVSTAGLGTYQLQTVGVTTPKNVFQGATYLGPMYTFNATPPVTGTATSLTTIAGNNGTSSPATITTAGTYTIYGMKIVAGAGSPVSITALNFTTSNASGNSYFYGTAYLFAGTAAGPTGAAIGTISPTTASQTLSFTGLAGQTLTAGGTLYYFVEIVYSAPGASPSASTTLSFVSAAGPTITNGAVAGPAYTYNTLPTVIASTVPAADLTGGTIYIGQTNIAGAGIALSTTIGTTTLSQLTFSFTPNVAATLAAYFTNLRVVSSSNPLTNPFTYAGTTVVATGASVAIGAGTITATIAAATITTTTTYYYLVADYTVTTPVAATPKTFTFDPKSYTTALSGTVSPTYTANTFVCTQPTYYWTGATNTNWTTGSNWEETTTAPIIVTGYYPGQVATTDNVVISPVQTTPTINLTANETIATLTNSAGITTALNINGGALKLNVSNQLNLGSTTSGAAASSLTLGGSGILDINNDAEINYSGTLVVPANGNITIDNGATVNLNGNTGQLAKITLSGGLIQSNGGDFEFNNAGAILSATAGTWNAVTNTTINLNAANNQIINNGATINVFDTNNFTFNSGSDNVTNTTGTFNITHTTVDAYNGTIIVNGGIMNINSDAGGGSDVELGDIVYFFGFPIAETNGTMTVNTGGTVNVSGASQIHTAWTASTLTNNGGLINVTTGSQIFADYAAFNNTSGTTNVNASTVQLAVGGTSLTNAGTMNFSAASIIEFTYQLSSLTNTGTFNTANTAIDFAANTCQVSNTAGSFNFGSGSVMNMTSSKSTVINSGTGIFTCSPTSIFNLTYAGTAANAPTVTNNSSNPFTLLSDATGSATIGKITTIATNGSFIGSFNVQRYISTASRNYRLLSSPVNKTMALPGTAGSPDQVDISALGQSVSSPATYNGAFIGGPGAGFTNHVANPLLYLYQESILPGTSENSTFTSGKNVGISNITVGSPYLETTVSTAAGGTTPSDNSTTVKIPAGNAYLLYYIHDNTSTSVSSPLTTATTTANGFINQGPIPFILWGSGTLTTALTYTTGAGALYPGVTMVGNPYASTIDLKQVYTDNAVAANIFTAGSGEAFYELDPTTEQFVSYNYNGTTATTSGSTASEYIASGQGFYVTVLATKGGKIFNFAEDQKTTSTTTPVFPVTTLEGVQTGPGTTVDNVSPGNVKTINSVLSPAGNGSHTLSVSSVKNASFVPSGLAGAAAKTNTPKVYTYPVPDTATTPTPPVSTLTGMHLKLVMDSLTYDECGLYFSKNYSDNFDNNDANDLDGTGGKVYLSSYSADHLRTGINALGNYAVTGGKRVKLFVKFSASGLYKLQLADIANFSSANYSVFLLDKMLNDSLDLTLYKSYNFNYVAGTANDSTRFVLAIEHKPVPHYALLSFAGAKNTDGVLLDWKTLNEANNVAFVLQKLAANNTYVFLDSLHSDSAGAYSYIDQHPTLGNNTYRLQQTDGLGDITYSAPVTIGYNSSAPNGGLNIYPNPAKSSITVTLTTSSTATQVATADIYNTSGKLIEHKAVSSNSFTQDVSAYQLGVYIIELKNNNGVLVGKSKFVKVQ